MPDSNTPHDCPQSPIKDSSCRIFKPPQKPDRERKSVFLAGSIEMGSAVDWQSQMEQKLSHLPITIMNPRRSDWDKTWPQTPEFPPFKEQFVWELDGLEKSDVIAMYFDEHAKAPITLLEFGLHAQSRKMIVCCLERFWRSGNVQITCGYYSIERVPSLEKLAERVGEGISSSTAASPEKSTTDAIEILKPIFYLTYDSLDTRTQRLFSYLVAYPTYTNVDTIFQLHHIPWYEQSPRGLCFKMFGRKEWTSEDTLKHFFPRRKSYDKTLRRLSQLGLVEE